MGMWGSAGDMGNLLGLFLFTCLLYYIKADWKFCMVIPVIFSLVMNLLLRVLLEDDFENDEEREQANWVFKFNRIKEYFLSL